MSNLHNRRLARVGLDLALVASSVLIVFFANVVAFAAPRPTHYPPSNPPAGCRNTSGCHNHVGGAVGTANGSLQSLTTEQSFEVEVYLFLGNKARDAGNYDEAIKHYRHVLDLNDKEWRGHYGLGNVSFDKSFSETDEPSSVGAASMADAIAEYKRAAILGKQNKADNAELAELYSDLAEAYLHRGMLPEAKASVATALLLNSGSASAVRREGNIYFAENRFDDAIAKYIASLTIDSKNGLTHEALGAAYIQKIQPGTTYEQQALSEFQKAVRFKPDYIFGHETLGEFYFRRNRFTEAIEPYKQALRLNPNLLFTRARLVLAYYHAENYDAARREFAALKARSPAKANELRPELRPHLPNL